MRIRQFSLALATVAALGATSTAFASPPGHGYQLAPRNIATSEQFRGLAAVSSSTAWVSGENGGVYLTTNAGMTWRDVSPATARAEGLALRDIEAWDASHAVALSIGPDGDSRIFRTNDGGRTWVEAFRNTDEAAFYDCMAFDSRGTGLVMSDPVGGYLRIARSTDRGASWTVLPTAGMPKALDGEFGFAASGTCIVADSAGTPGHFWIATGGQRPRVFETRNAGRTWQVSPAPVRGGDTAGVYSIAFDNPRRGVAVGGDFMAPGDGSRASAWTRSGSRHLRAGGDLGGYRSGVDWVPGPGNVAIAVGPTGSDITRNGGVSWQPLGTTAYDGLHCAKDGACWASGPKGAVAILTAGQPR